MVTANTWLIVTGIFALALCLAIVWLFSDLELKFPGSEHVAPAVRKQLGKFLLIITGLTIIVLPVLLLNVGFLRYWVGVICLFLSLIFLIGSMRHIRTEIGEHKSGTREAI